MARVTREECSVKVLVTIYDEGPPDDRLPESERPHRYWAQLPGMPGVITVGDTREELLANLREALQGCLLVAAGDYEPEPGGRQEEVEL
jgi:predicted RNase H-like HicB family nuclease